MRDQPEPLMNTQQLAEYLGVSTRTLRGWRLKGKGPRFIQITENERSIYRYRPTDVKKWLWRNHE